MNTFTDGVARGGLREKSDIKVLICYLLKTLKRPLTRTQINEIFSEHEIANYFEINSAISELIAGQQVDSELSDGDELISITPRMELEVCKIERTIPRSLRERAVSEAYKIFSRERIINECKVSVEKLAHGFHITFAVEDGDTELLKITVYAPDESQVEVAKKNFYANAVSIYSDIISALTVE